MNFDDGAPQPILLDGRVVGFVERVGPIYVGLLGDRYDRAEEVTQKLTLEEALSALLNRVPVEQPRGRGHSPT